MKALEEKIAALSNALQVMTENKAKTEAAFQADKKTMLVIYWIKRCIGIVAKFRF